MFTIINEKIIIPKAACFALFPPHITRKNPNTNPNNPKIEPNANRYSIAFPIESK